MDWIEDFVEKFAEYYEVQNIKRDKLHGTLEINFNAGMPHNYNLKIHRRATLTQGVKDV